ncbi:hypothetical protein GCM10010174_27390 [Kutzneria viridogrisea]|uniref:MbtH-like domain-containing protein n=3 Tax=Kutzneria TaxID=43356 RepID=W5W7X8_9PSEU|nr:MbtH family NRPS accessory protein [Kutzneria albida]AHH97243.1 hypothetical protein KALB_3879 [Kutzneria albida DSM 43870]MBA8930843.1 MbtH protein [Kutzneria viridogrisea]
MSEECSRKRTVFANHEEQYSIWFADRDRPPGWRPDGMTGAKAECPERIGRNWVDLRPVCLRAG